MVFPNGYGLLFSPRSGHAVLPLLLLPLLLLPLLLVPAAEVHAQAGPSEPDTHALYVGETVSASLSVIRDGVESGNLAEAGRLARINTEILPPYLEDLRKLDAVTTDELHLGLLDLHTEIGSASAPADRILASVDRLESLLSGYAPADPDYGTAIAMMLAVADEQYQYSAAEEDGSAYRLSYLLALRSAELFQNTDYDERLTLEVASFLDELVQKIRDGDDFHSVGTLINAINRDLVGHDPAVYDKQRLYGAIRGLYAQMLDALDAGDYAAAEELGIEAYLENFEYLEPDIERVDADLLYALEWDMREELRRMIQNGQDAKRIRTFVEGSILPDLAEAEAAVAVAAGLGGGAAGAFPERDLKEMGDATDDQKSEVRDEIDFIRATLQEMLAVYGAGDAQAAHTLARTAYLDSYEYVEIPLRAIDPDFTLEVEFQFAELRSLIREGAEYGRVQEAAVAIKRNLDESERIVSGTGTLAPTIAFTSSFAVIFREGLESVLILGAIITYLEASRNHRFKRYINYGVVAALGATVLTWVVASYIIEISGANRELIEAVAALSATAVLFYVSFWVLNKIEHRKWMEFVKAKVWQATTTGSVTVFVMLAFFTVYREGFETVLFYQAMLGLARHMELYVGAGFAAGMAALLVLYYVMRRLGRRLPLRALFGLTMGVGAYLSIAFLGNGIRELQVLDIVPTTSLIGTVPRLDINVATMTGIYPTLESIVGQVVLLSVYLAASTYVLVLSPRRARRLASMRVSRGDSDGIET